MLLRTLLCVAFLATGSLQHTAILPPNPDKVLRANSSETPEGCKKLASDKGWPADNVWRAALPGAFKKLKGTEAPDWMFQASSISDVQKAIKFAKEHNVRLTVISTGHDFLGRLVLANDYLTDYKIIELIGCRQRARSGLRLDMAAFREPTVFAAEWKCGDVLKPTSKTGRVVDEIQACRVPKTKRSLSTLIPHRNHDYRFFEKRHTDNCTQLLEMHTKRQDTMHSMGDHAGSTELEQFNIIKPKPGQPAYARVSAGMYNELFFSQADKSGLMTVGAQHGVRWKSRKSKDINLISHRALE
jgi:hypothetical protein